MGGVRTALYNYLYARKHGGDFVLRIEDTDQTRYVKGAEDFIQESLEWCGITPDEGPKKGGGYGPYRQSERKSMYSQFADQLVASGNAYYAFDTPEELEQMRENLKAAGQASPQYNSVTRNSMKNSLTLSEDQVKNRIDKGDPYTIRIKVPRNEEIRFHDEIRGWVVVHSSNMDDKVLFKSDGMPTYHLANVVDDYAMKISHVIRGEEWLPSAPLHVLLYRYLGWENEMPKLAHLPLILKPDGNGKLSKRDGDRLGFPVFPLEWEDPQSGEISSGYREKGYYAEAFVNMLAFLGWNPGTEQEVFSMQELIDEFTLERVGKAGAKFDLDKTNWFNQQYLRAQPDEQLAKSFVELLKERGIEAEVSYAQRVVPHLKERSSFVRDLMNGLYFFQAPSDYDEKTLRKKWKDETPQIMRNWLAIMKDIEPFEESTIEATFKAYLEDEGLGFGQVMPNLRLVLTGRGMGPSLFAICELLGKEECIVRIENGISKLSNG